MTWLQFLLWVTGIYILYYLLMILIDSAGGARARAGQAMSQELTFAEYHEPEKLAHIEEVPDAVSGDTPKTTMVLKPQGEPETISSGGVSLRELFSLAREEAIVYTHPVSF